MTSSGARDEDSAAAFFAAVSRELHSSRDEQWTVDRIAERAVDAVPSADFCGVTLRRRRGRLETVASTQPLAERCDDLQYQLGEGPCMDAALHADPHRIRDMERDERWPRWSKAVAELGVRSLLAVQLGADAMGESHGPLGAINFYSREPDAFSEDDFDLALIYATHAASALASARTITGLEAAVHGRHLIGVAQGILMQRYGLGMDQAFETLQRYSSTGNLKLRDLAWIVIAGRALPDPPSATTAGEPAPDPT
jgi:GAF domain-containing protein